jgi:hypothetical protein
MNGPKVIEIGNNFERIIPVKPIYYECYLSNIYLSLGNFDIDKFHINPLKVIKVNPENILQTTGRKWKPWSSPIDSIGKVTGGDWDTTPVSNVPDDRTYSKQYESHDLHQAFVNRFNNGVD